MSFFGSMNVSATGLAAQRARMDIHAQNLANVETTRTPEGGPYQRRAVILEERGQLDFHSVLHSSMRQSAGGRGRHANSATFPGGSGGTQFHNAVGSAVRRGVNQNFVNRGLPVNMMRGGVDTGGRGVQIHSIQTDDTPGPRTYDPGHPDADIYGYVMRPNVNVIAEMVNMISATRSYEANMTAMNAVQSMMSRTLDMAGR